METTKIILASKNDMHDLFDEKGRFVRDNTTIKYFELLPRISDEEDLGIYAFKTIIRHPEPEHGYILPHKKIIKINDLPKCINNYDSINKKVKKSQVFRLPVEWSVYGYAEIEATCLEEALKKFFKEKEDIPLDTNPEYIDGTYMLSGEDEYGNNIENLKEYIENYYGNCLYYD